IPSSHSLECFILSLRESEFMGVKMAKARRPWVYALSCMIQGETGCSSEDEIADFSEMFKAIDIIKM
ncbi:hypothetical protein ABZP36_035717, partial [Zizania latifolia]